MKIDPVVIGPHTAEFDPAIIPGFHESFIQATLEEGPVIPVPVENPEIDAVIGCGVDFPFHGPGF
jgi:hypothetical protein